MSKVSDEAWLISGLVTKRFYIPLLDPGVNYCLLSQIQSCVSNVVDFQADVFYTAV